MFLHRSGGCRGLVVAAGCVGLVLSVGGCGDDDDDADGAADNAFCTAGPAVDAALAPEEPDPAAIEAAVAAAEAAAPEEIEDDVQTAVSGVREALATENFDLFETDEMGEALSSINEYYVSDCGFEEIAVNGTEYAFAGVPETVKAGPALLRLSNEGQEFHEAIVFRVNDGVDLSVTEILELPEEEAGTMVEEMGATFAEPGDAGATTLSLQPGRYAMVCFIPEGMTPQAAEEAEQSGTEPEGAPHFTLGMASEFTVE
jgi:uncharacterized cupredoxin-like copper-binding protein